MLYVHMILLTQTLTLVCLFSLLQTDCASVLSIFVSVMWVYLQVVVHTLVALCSRVSGVVDCPTVGWQQWSASVRCLVLTFIISSQLSKALQINCECCLLWEGCAGEVSLLLVPLCVLGLV